MDSTHAETSYALAPDVQTWPLDTSTRGERFLVEVGTERRFEVTAGVHQVLQLLRERDRTVGDIASELSGRGYAHAAPERIARLIDKVLIPRGMVEAPDGREIRLAAAGPKRADYLRVQVPLIRPQTVRPLTALLSRLFHPVMALPLLGVAILAQFYFFLDVSPEFSWQVTSLPLLHYVLLLLILNGTAMLHELGHAAACLRFGCPHGRIGWGIYLFIPVLFTDVSPAWRLNRKQRAVVDSGGMYMEILVACAALGLYHWTGNDLYVYLFIFLELSLLRSLNPILRRDGYWLMADLSGQPHLREASLGALRQGVAGLLGREVEDEPLLRGMPRWMRHSLYLYTLAAVTFTGLMVYWVSLRILGEVIPRAPVLLAEMVQGLTPGSFDVPAVLDASLRLGFSLLFLYFVLSLGIRLVGSSARWLTGKESQSPEAADDAEGREASTEQRPASERKEKEAA